MKSTVTSVVVNAPARAVYDLASATEQWPVLLPHYRFVRILSQDGGERTIEMAARRGVIPIRWTAVQRNDPDTPSIYFRHLTGWTQGMEVWWRFDERERDTVVSISHDLDFAFPVAAAFIEEHVVAEYFIEGVARRTLAHMKRLAEEAVHV